MSENKLGAFGWYQPIKTNKLTTDAGTNVVHVTDDGKQFFNLKQRIKDLEASLQEERNKMASYMVKYNSKVDSVICLKAENEIFKQFIRNGLDLGYIKYPEKNDPAYETIKRIFSYEEGCE